jgi:hypothetical protein
MNQRRRLQGLSGLLLGHFGRRQPPQFVINHRKQFLGSLQIATLGALDDLGDLADESSLKNQR